MSMFLDMAQASFVFRTGNAHARIVDASATSYEEDCKAIDSVTLDQDDLREVRKNRMQMAGMIEVVAAMPQGTSLFASPM